MKNIVIVLFIVFILVGCSSSNEISNGEITEPSYIEFSNNDGVFDLRLYIEDRVYRSKEPINAYATLEYVGENKDITIWHGIPYIQFGLKGDDGFIMDSITLDTLESTILDKGVVNKFPFVKSGGWDTEGEDAKMWEEFYRTKELFLAKGTYEIKVYTNFKLGDNDIEYSNSVATAIEVKR